MDGGVGSFGQELSVENEESSAGGVIGANDCVAAVWEGGVPCD